MYFICFLVVYFICFWCLQQCPQSHGNGNSSCTKFIWAFTNMKIPVRHTDKTHFLRLLVQVRYFSCNDPSPCPVKKKYKFDPNKPQPKIVIVGAGIAGLSAAHRLLQTGLQDIIVCEASERPGGKIQSYILRNVVGELGAQWLHGGNSANPVMGLASCAGVLPSPFPRMKQPSQKPPTYFTSKGVPICSQIAQAGYQLFKQVVEQAASLFNISSTKDLGSLDKFLTLRLNQELGGISEHHQFDVDRVFTALKNDLRGVIGADLDKINSRQFGGSLKIPGNPVRVPLGMVTVLSPLLEEIPSSKIKYTKSVANIKWDGTNPRVSVKCQDGDILPADYVIVAIPPGVLKANVDTMFTPCLPEDKANAIRNIGVGFLERIIVEFAKPFWAPCEGSFHFAWSEKELRDRDCWLKGITKIEELPGTNDTLLVTVAGKEAKEVQNMSVESIAREFVDLVRVFTNNSTIPYPSNVVKSSWSTNPLFLGGTVFMGGNCDISTLCNVAKPWPDMCSPVAPIIFFAGEGTIPGYFGTLHGARMSGIREAERIISLTEQFNGPPKSCPISNVKSSPQVSNDTCPREQKSKKSKCDAKMALCAAKKSKKCQTSKPPKIPPKKSPCPSQDPPAKSSCKPKSPKK